MTRTKIKDRHLPDYTKGEELFNTVSHIVGGGIGIIALCLCVIVSAIHADPWAVVGSAIYGASFVALYTVSSVYHGLKTVHSKKIMQIIDHCTIYFLIGGTYTPILFCSIRRQSPVWAWVIFGIVWGCAFMAAALTAIDLKKYEVLSMVCYVCMGWCILICTKTLINSMEQLGLVYLLAGGIAYTVGAVLYGIGKKKRYMHGIFHVFVVIGSVLHLICILFYVI